MIKQKLLWETLPNHIFVFSNKKFISVEKGIPLIIDNTASPVIYEPLAHGVQS